jgi:hypothetical protein
MISFDSDLGGAISASGMNYPYGAITTNGKLILTDYSNHRILFYNSIPTSNGAAADYVFGQADFIHGSSNVVAVQTQIHSTVLGLLL